MLRLSELEKVLCSADCGRVLDLGTVLAAFAGLHFWKKHARIRQIWQIITLKEAARADCPFYQPASWDFCVLLCWEAELARRVLQNRYLETKETRKHRFAGTCSSCNDTCVLKFPVNPCGDIDLKNGLLGLYRAFLISEFLLMDIFQKKGTFCGHFDISIGKANFFWFFLAIIESSVTFQSLRREHFSRDHFWGRYPRRGAKNDIPARVNPCGQSDQVIVWFNFARNFIT